MSPEIARGRARTAQIIAAAALLLAALSILLSVVLFARLATTDKELQRSREAVTHHVCDALGTLIVRGATDSKLFEPLIRRAAPEAPTYEMRVSRAKKDARTLCLKIRRATAAPSP